MDLELLLFASLKDDVGSPTLRLTIPEGSTVSNLLQEIGESHPYLQAKLAHVRVAIGGMSLQARKLSFPRVRKSH